MQVSPSCYALTGLGYLPPWTVNAGIIAGATKTLVVDTGPTLLAAQTILGYARAVKPGNQVAAINTERHLDHLGGNAYFREQGLNVYGHSGIQRKETDLAEDLADYTACIPSQVRRAANEGQLFYQGTTIANPNRPLEAETELDLGVLIARIIFTPGHTPTNLTVWLPDERVIFTGDCLVAGYIPNLESGNPDEWQRWLTSLERIRQLNPVVLVAGHGKVLFADEISAEIDRHKQVLQAAIARGVAPTIV